MRFILILLCLFSFLEGKTQPSNDDCANATILCGAQSVLANNIGATTNAQDATICFPMNNTTWYSFTTNAVGGNANINFSNINCNSNNSYDNEIEAVVIEALTPCNSGSYTAISPCFLNNSSDFSIPLSNLQPSKTYYILVDGDLNGAGITNAAECSFNIETTGEAVEYIVDAGIDVSIEAQTSTPLEGIAPSGSTWSPPNNLSNTTSLNPVASPNETTTYFLTYNNGTCVYFDDVVISVQSPLTIPNTITPNNDGFNDTWKIERIDNYPNAEVTIYDRWGQQVFGAIGYTNSRRWNGTQNGNRLPSGTYFYNIDLKTGMSNSVFVGSITLIH